MAKAIGGKGAGGRVAVLLEEVVLAQAYELDALMNVLERKRFITKAEAMDEIKRLRDKAAKPH